MRSEPEFKRLLVDAKPPDAPQARERAAAAARLAAAARSHAAPWRGLRPAVVGFAAIALVGLAFTAPGRAVTGEVAELVGIGGPPTVDHEGGHLDPTTGEIVIATGTTADGANYEFVAFEATQAEQDIRQQTQMGQDVIDSVREARDQTGQDIPIPDLPAPNRVAGSCIAFDWIEQANPRGGGTCIDGPQVNPLTVNGTSDTRGRYGPAAEVVISGQTSPEVARVEVSYERPDGERVVADGALGRLTGELAQRVGVSEQFGSFVAFIPASDLGPGGSYAEVVETVETVAYGDDGREIKRVEGAPSPAGGPAGEDRPDGLLRVEDTRVFPLLDQNGEPVPNSDQVRLLRPSRTCPQQTAALERAGHEFDAFAGPECPPMEAVRAFIASGAPIALPRTRAVPSE